jgi:hypothetical protein
MLKKTISKDRRLRDDAAGEEKRDSKTCLFVHPIRGSNVGGVTDLDKQAIVFPYGHGCTYHNTQRPKEEANELDDCYTES